MNDIDMFNEFLAEEHPELPPLPTHKEVCDRCHGEGELRGYPGVYTQDDFDSGEIDFEGYCSYRRVCPDCNGLRVLDVVTESPGSETHRLWREYRRDINESRAIEAQERRMGA